MSVINKLYNNMGYLEKSLDVTHTRNEVLAQNIANAETPNYKRKDVKFEEFLQGAMGNFLKGIRTDYRHIPIGGTGFNDTNALIVQDNRELSMRIDGNNVDIENEMALLAKNTILNNFLVSKINGKFNSLRTVLSEGRR